MAATAMATWLYALNHTSSIAKAQGVSTPVNWTTDLEDPSGDFLLRIQDTVM